MGSTNITHNVTTMTSLPELLSSTTQFPTTVLTLVDISAENNTPHHSNVTEFDLIMGYTLIPIFMLTVATNILTIVVAFKLASCNKNITDLFVFFLAWTDLILGLLVLPIVTASHFNGSIFGGIHMCHFNFFVVNTTVQASAFFVLVMSIERWVAFVKPLYYKSRFTFKTAKILIATVMVYSIATSLLPLFGVGEIGNFDYVCMIDWQTKELDGQILVWFQLVLGLISILAVWYFNIAVGYSVWNMRKKRKVRARTQDTTRGKMEIKFFRLTACVAICYSVCWAPYLINPIIYGATKRSYLNGYCHMVKVWWYYLTCGCCFKKPTDDEFLVKVAGRRRQSIIQFSSSRSQSVISNGKTTIAALAKSNSKQQFAALDENEEKAEEIQENTTSACDGQVNLAFDGEYDSNGHLNLELKCSNEDKKSVEN